MMNQTFNKNDPISVFHNLLRVSAAVTLQEVRKSRNLAFQSVFDHRSLYHGRRPVDFVLER